LIILLYIWFLNHDERLHGHHGKLEELNTDGDKSGTVSGVVYDDDVKDGEDEDDGGRTRRVGFALSEDFTEKEGKLQRRDTPHHLKNKRISSVSGQSAESEAEKVRRILAMVATGNQSSTSATSDDADQRPSVKVVNMF